MEKDPANSRELCYKALFVVCPCDLWRLMKALSEGEILKENQGGSSVEGRSKHSEAGKGIKGSTNRALKGDPKVVQEDKGKKVREGRQKGRERGMADIKEYTDCGM